jgi:hypothetical protein
MSVQFIQKGGIRNAITTLPSIAQKFTQLVAGNSSRHFEKAFYPVATTRKSAVSHVVPHVPRTTTENLIFNMLVDYPMVKCFEYNVVVVENPSLLEVAIVNQQVGIPGIVRNGVVVPQSNHPLPEGTHVEIRVEPGDVPAGLMSEIEAWDKASDESWKWIESLEANEA